MKPLRLSVLAVALVLAGCTASPTDAPLRDPAAPSFDEGVNTTGSGNREDDGVTEETTVPSDSTTTGRGGNGLGSGN
jgi:hypothetical protein